MAADNIAMAAYFILLTVLSASGSTELTTTAGDTQQQMADQEQTDVNSKAASSWDPAPTPGNAPRIEETHAARVDDAPKKTKSVKPKASKAWKVTGQMQHKKIVEASLILSLPTT